VKGGNDAYRLKTGDGLREDGSPTGEKLVVWAWSAGAFGRQTLAARSARAAKRQRRGVTA
jgi:hypothetical protein